MKQQGRLQQTLRQVSLGVYLPVAGETEEGLEERLGSKCWPHIDDYRCWLLEGIAPDMRGSRWNDHCFASFRHPSLLSPSNLQTPLCNRELFFRPWMHMKIWDAPAWKDVQADTQAFTASAPRGFEERQPLACEWMFDRFSNVGHLRPLFLGGPPIQAVHKSFSASLSRSNKVTNSTDGGRTPLGVTPHPAFPTAR